MSKRKFGIYIPSYKRAATISTHGTTASMLFSRQEMVTRQKENLAMSVK